MVALLPEDEREQLARELAATGVVDDCAFVHGLGVQYGHFTNALSLYTFSKVVCLLCYSV
jgi:hypothetical protein